MTTEDSDRGRSAPLERLFLHGGDIRAAASAFPDAPQPWIDLSTGVNPVAYPIAALPDDSWERLPDPSQLKALQTAAAERYGANPDCVVAAPGTQALIQWLPRLFPARRVAVIDSTYSEHEFELARLRRGRRRHPGNFRHRRPSAGGRRESEQPRRAALFAARDGEPRRSSGAQRPGAHRGRSFYGFRARVGGSRASRQHHRPQVVRQSLRASRAASRLRARDAGSRVDDSARPGSVGDLRPGARNRTPRPARSGMAGWGAGSPLRRRSVA